MLLNSLYPTGPDGVPADLTAPTPAYKRHAWLAMAGLLAFVGGYLGVTAWFGLTAYRLLASGHGLHAVLGLVPLFAFAFLLRGLFAIKHHDTPARVEVTALQEPKLFEFLHRVADETGAPRPHRVFLSSRVNAAVFYDLSLLNLILPSRKNLELGLGLMNVLTVSEMKAVVAHEFGHFAQSTMAIGRWTYAAEQIVGQVVAERGIFDKALSAMARLDVRVAWIAYLMRLLVWSLRAVLDTGFRGVIWARSALSREMELNADLVAVSVTGSDCLIHALHKLHAADEAYDRSVKLIDAELGAGRPVDDLFAVQSKVLATMREIRNDPNYGLVAPLPEASRAQVRLFPEGLGQPPRMWATHPPNREREENAKRRYIPSTFDDRDAWALLSDAGSTRRQVTRQLLQSALGRELPPPAPIEITLEHVTRKLGRAFHDRRYRGVYLGRSVVLATKTVRELYQNPKQPGEANCGLDALYPERLTDELGHWRAVEEEHAALQALKAGLLAAPGGMLKHRGRELRRRDLARAIAQVDQERKAAAEVVLGHDRACRSAHRAAAQQLGRGWDAQLEGLLALLHYAEHRAADLVDARGHLQHVLAVAMADRRITDTELAQVLASASDLQRVLMCVATDAAIVVLPEPVAKRLQLGSWREALPQQRLIAPPSPENVGEWLGAIDSWVESLCAALEELAAASLEALVESEAHVAACSLQARDPGDAPAPAVVPQKYATLTPGAARARETRLSLLQRVLVGDGPFAMVVRLAVAGGVLSLGFVASSSVQLATVHVYNGLERAVEVHVGVRALSLRARGHGDVEVPANTRLTIRSSVHSPAEATIESFDVEALDPGGAYAYNVASAASLVRWTAAYGSAKPEALRKLGAPRWLAVDCDVFFAAPPSSVSTKHGSATRKVLEALGDESVPVQLAAAPEASRQAMILAHARWDEASSPQLAQWMAAAQSTPELVGIVRERLVTRPRDVQLLRVEQELDREQACARQARQFAGDTDGDSLYLRARCIDDRNEGAQAVLDAYARHPENAWLAYSAGFAFARRAQWDAAGAALEQASRLLPQVAAETASELARVRRMLADAPAAANLDDLLGRSEPLAVLAALQPAASPAAQRAAPLGPEFELSAAAQRALHAGDLAGALQSVQGVQYLQDQMLRLCAASDGATDAMKAAAAQLPLDRGMGHANLWITIAATARNGGALERFVPIVRSAMGQEADAMLEWADPHKLRTERERLETALVSLTPSTRGVARLMAVLVLRDEAPDAWWNEAERLLFPAERPYLQRLDRAQHSDAAP